MRSLPFLVVLLLLAGCLSRTPAPVGDDGAGPSTGGDEDACPAAIPAPVGRTGAGAVTLLTYTAFGLSADDFADFTNATGWTVEIVQSGDAGEALTKAIVTKDAPVADLLFGVDNALVARAKDADLFEPYVSPALAGVPEALREPFCSNGALVATPIDHGYVMLNYDTAWFAARGLALPTDLAEVADPTYAPLTVVENPFTSSPGTAFLLATVRAFGDPGYTDWWRDFVANGGKVVTDWDTAYGKEFTQGYDATGAHDRPVVVSYSTSPAFNPMYGYGNATSANLDLPKGAWHQIEAAGVLRHARNADGAMALVDWMLAKDVQERLAFAQVVYPVHIDAAAPAAYAEHAPEPADPAELPPDAIEANREKWLEGWREATGQG